MKMKGRKGALAGSGRFGERNVADGRVEMKLQSLKQVGPQSLKHGKERGRSLLPGSIRGEYRPKS